ncbi:MarR family winged helix-turn-helix transcriptional regulator [Nonomuraea sp. NPDC050556]|uniref:MarR family winged helix-turn-helix transcriptional regulator n=1 Tax=Nonomuraea sp. NPDC050556 TaxID=3364369 RepID=UPI00378A8E26
MSNDIAREVTEQLFDLSIALDFIGNAAAERIGINQTDLICLNLLVRQGPMSPSQVAAVLGLSTAAISAMARRLESGGYAYREIDPVDRRRILMHASPAGTQRAFGLFDDLYQAMTGLVDGYGAEDAEKLVRMLGDFQRVLTEHAESIRTRR